MDREKLIKELKRRIYFAKLNKEEETEYELTDLLNWVINHS